MKDFKLDEDVKISNGINPPDSYFNSFSDNITTRLEIEKQKTIPLYAKKSTWIYSAAAILIVSIGFVNFKNSSVNMILTPSEVQNGQVYNSSTITPENLSNENNINNDANLNLDESAIEDILEENPNLEQIIITM